MAIKTLLFLFFHERGFWNILQLVKVCYKIRMYPYFHFLYERITKVDGYSRAGLQQARHSFHVTSLYVSSYQHFLLLRQYFQKLAISELWKLRIGVVKSWLIFSQSWLFMILKKEPFENIAGKGENAGDQHFLLFPQYFLPFPKQTSIFLLHIFYCLKMLSISTSLKFYRLVKS